MDPERDDLLEQELNSTEEIELEEELLPVEETEEETDPEVVERAKKYGHLSKEDWEAQGRDPKDWKSPEEFDKTGKAIEQLYSLKKKVDQRDREIQALIDYQERTKQREYERAKKDLEARLAASKDDMDVEGVSHYTKELTRLEDQENHSRVQQTQESQTRAKEDFIERNQHWFNDRNPDLQQRAIEIDNEIRDLLNKGQLKVNSYDDIAVMIENRLKYEHPDRVLGPTQNARPSVAPSRSSVNKTAVNTSSAKKTFQSLSQDLKDTYNSYKRVRASMGQDLTEAEFIEKLKRDGEI
jgi:hypothetical protein